MSEVDRELMGLGVSRVCKGGLGRKSKIQARHPMTSVACAMQVAVLAVKMRVGALQVLHGVSS
eukprot:3168328-Prymnesium_polylepis.1